MSKQRTLVNVKLDPEKKQKWEQAVEDSDEYSSLSHLIRMSVQRELAGMYQPETTTGETAGLDADAQSQLDSIEEHVEKIAEQMDTVETEALSSADITDLADRLYDLIPEFEVVERESETVDVEELSEEELEELREDAPDDADLQEVERPPEYEWGEIRPPADEMSAKDGARILSRVSEVVDDTSDIDSAVRELDEAELRSLTETGLLSVYREYLEVYDYDIHQAADKLTEEYPSVKRDTIGENDEILYEVVLA